MQVFINERSLNEQYYEASQLTGLVDSFVKSAQLIKSVKADKVVNQSRHMYVYSAVVGSVLAASLQRNKTLNDLFFNNLQSIGAVMWEDLQEHSNEFSYIFNAEDYVGSSVAEISHRKNGNNEFIGFLLNFSDSKFASLLNADVRIDDKHDVQVDCADTEQAVFNWLVRNGFLDPAAAYDETSGEPPQDYQTILADRAKFEPTQYRNQNRIAYRKIGTNQLWAVDRSKRHAGVKAHIEVFDETTREHLGTSLYNEDNLDTNHVVPNRKINLNSR